ncbi:acyltransferase family protein [Paraburkholderia nodosa]|uniref:acyltransferase family protein n=1 Tax=Paraburkholderia nodosa TaxID=392320 RepID=UPI00048591F6|nr:acyltransferase [Paraburkholderia nodosa]
MGIYRLLLAVAVMLSHIGIAWYGHNPGVIAVVSFYLLSGYVMTALVQRHYTTLDSIPSFYLDRMMRLFPQFLFYSLLTLALIICFHPASDFISGLTPATAALNLTMLPLNFFRYFPNALTIPQAWSLGLESQFYLAIPFILILRLRVPVLLLSLAFFLLPYLGVLDSDTWGYRMLPGTLFVFLLGSFLRTGEHKALTMFAYAACAILLGAGIAGNAIRFPLFEVLFGVVIGAPIVLALTKIRFGRLEEFAGNLSYGMFLNHFFILWSFQIAGFHQDSKLYIPGLLIASVILAWGSYELVEKRVISLRHALRKRSPASSEYVPASEHLKAE